jgi:hypothetical protein
MKRESIPQNIKTFKQFWPFYLREHTKPSTRYVHVVGSILALLILISALVTGDWVLLIGAPLCGYAFAWFSHFVLERNLPATLRYPLFSLVADYLMAYKVLTGKISEDLRKAGVV